MTIPDSSPSSFPLKYDSDLGPTETYLVMEKLVEKGLVRDIGLSNFNSEQISDVLARCKVRPATNQVECHPYFNQSRLLAFMREHGVVMTAYSPLGSPDRPWALPDEPVLLEDPGLKGIASKHGKTPAQVVLRWMVRERKMLPIALPVFPFSVPLFLPGPARRLRRPQIRHTFAHRAEPCPVRLRADPGRDVDPGGLRQG